MKNRTRIVGLMAGLVLAVTAIVPTAAQVEEYPARRDALHQRHAVGTARQLEPDRRTGATPWAPSASSTSRSSTTTR